MEKKVKFEDIPDDIPMTISHEPPSDEHFIKINCGNCGILLVKLLNAQHVYLHDEGFYILCSDCWEKENG